MKNYIIYWMRGVWKTFFWRKVAEKLWINFIDLDHFIEEKIWEKIFKFIEKNWWKKFRELENKSLKEALKINKNKVISLWGWTICFENNHKLILNNNFKLVYIEANIELIKKWILWDEKDWNKRNSLTWKKLEDELEEVFNERKGIYEQFFDFKVINKNWEWVWETILEKINYWWICIPIVDFENIEDILEKIEKSKEIKFIELRIDFLKNKEILQDIISLSKRKLIITNRSHLETWNFKWNPEQSRKILEKSSKFWADFVDFELINWEKEIKKLKENLNPKTKLILSFHNFEKTPSEKEILEKINEMKEFWADICKIAVMPNCQKDVDLILELSKKYKNENLILISMWKLWKITRIKNVKNWELFTFWCLEWEKSAPWQINYKKLHKLIF